MKFQNLLALFIFLICNVVFSQEKISHIVLKGETVYSLAQKYQVKQSEIFDLNPKAKNGLKLDMVLQIPNKIQQVVVAEPTVHEVLPKETLYGISKKYSVSIDKIKEANPFIETEGLKIGAKVSIPNTSDTKVVGISKKEIKETKKEAVKKVEIVSAKVSEKAPVNSGEEIIHEVLAKETKYGISKKYGITIAELEALNPNIKSGLAIGYKLVIKNGVQKVPTVVEEKIDVVTNETPIAENKKEKVEKPKSQFKIIGRVESDKNEEIVQVKPQIEETNDDSTEAITSELPITEVAPLSPENMTKAEFLIAKASENLGARYRSGATGNGGFDCSGLMFVTFKEIDLTLPRSSRDMAANAGVRIDKNQAQKGDLIFFNTSGRGVSHVGMVTEVLDDEIKFIHSSTSSGVIVSSTKEAYYAKRFVQVNRVLEN